MPRDGIGPVNISINHPQITRNCDRCQVKSTYYHKVNRGGVVYSSGKSSFVLQCGAFEVSRGICSIRQEDSSQSSLQARPHFFQLYSVDLVFRETVYVYIDASTLASSISLSGLSFYWHINSIFLPDSLRPPLLVSWSVDASSLSQLLDGLLDGSSSNRPQVFFSFELIHFWILPISCQCSASIAECSQNDGAHNSIAENCRSCANCICFSSFTMP